MGQVFPFSVGQSGIVAGRSLLGQSGRVGKMRCIESVGEKAGRRLEMFSEIIALSFNTLTVVHNTAVFVPFFNCLQQLILSVNNFEHLLCA